jgi:hypothetical protein
VDSERRVRDLEARNAELRRLLVEANDEIVRLESRLRPLRVRARERVTLGRRALGRRFPALARFARRVRSRPA